MQTSGQTGSATSSPPKNVEKNIVYHKISWYPRIYPKKVWFKRQKCELTPQRNFERPSIQWTCLTGQNIPRSPQPPPHPASKKPFNSSLLAASRRKRTRWEAIEPQMLGTAATEPVMLTPCESTPVHFGSESPPKVINPQ